MASDFEAILEKLWQFAGELCDQVRIYQPDVVLVLMHSGWLPYFAGRELWELVESTDFPPVVCSNLGREKIEIFDDSVENPHALSSYFVGEFESEACIAFFLSWLGEKADWQAELKAQFQEQIGNADPQRILVVDEFIQEKSTLFLTLGLLGQIYPRAQTRFLNANLEWQNIFWETWVKNKQPELLQTEIFGPPPENKIHHPLWRSGRQAMLGTADIKPESLAWQKISTETLTSDGLTKFLPAETWLTLPVWAKKTVKDMISSRAGEYIPNRPLLNKRYPDLPLTNRLLGELFRRGSLSVRQVCDTFGLSRQQAQRVLLHMKDNGLILAQRKGQSNCFITSPKTQEGYWTRDLPLLQYYWMVPGKLMIGDMPGWDMQSPLDQLLPRLDLLLEQGITFFMDVSANYQNRPKSYQRLLELKANEKGQDVVYQNIYTPMRKMPQRSVLVKILDLVDNALEQGRVVYIHSLNTGGIEDALAGCWLVRHGMTGNQAIEKLQQAHSETLDGWRQIPYKERARKLIRGWKE